jgi:oligopeptide/dipeptide ABC transporter ATP-binding protein
MALLEVDALEVFLGPQGRETRVLRGLSFVLEAGQTLGIVGESGCGKSMTALALMGLLPSPSRVAGRVRFMDQDLVPMGEQERRALRGRHMAMVFQEPMTALNPVITVGWQIAEMLFIHGGLPREAALAAAVELLERVGIAEPQRRARAYPHELSGGMRQRVMIAMAMACRPELLIADEPTTALDVSVQAQILDLMLELQRDHGTALLFISHNFGVISEMADRVQVMYAGKVVEEGLTASVLLAPQHPYTAGLLQTLPDLGRRVSVLPVINGQVPDLAQLGPGCSFYPRCTRHAANCLAAEPPWQASTADAEGRVACFHV